VSNGNLAKTAVFLFQRQVEFDICTVSKLLLSSTLSSISTAISTAPYHLIRSFGVVDCLAVCNNEIVFRVQ